MGGIRIVNERNLERKRAGSFAAANMLLWAGLLVLIWGLLEKFNVVAIGAGAALCLLARHQMKRAGKKVCPGCGDAIEWEANACPACMRDVP